MAFKEEQVEILGHVSLSLWLRIHDSHLQLIHDPHLASTWLTQIQIIPQNSRYDLFPLWQKCVTQPLRPPPTPA